MRTLEMKIAIPEVNGGRCISAKMEDGYILAKFEIGENETSSISESELESRIDPNIFIGENETSSIPESELESRIDPNIFIGENETSSIPESELESRIDSNIFIGESETSSISESELECRIDPNIFAGAWLEHQPTSKSQKRILDLYQDAKAKGRLHAFTCMTIDISIKGGKWVYQKGLPIKTGFSQRKWAEILKDYNPSRNSRMMTLTEFACRNLYLIQELVGSGYEIAKAWKAVCDDSRKIGHYCNSDNHKYYFEPTGSREVCGFCDLGNAWKFIAEDPWEKTDGCWHAGGDYYNDFPVAALFHNCRVDVDSECGVGMLALD